jgi:hypothetical protein
LIPIAVKPEMMLCPLLLKLPLSEKLRFSFFIFIYNSSIN